jgi:hypothetical protein
MKIGETETEKDVKLIKECREIVKEIIRFGVNETHKLNIIYFLAMELENRSALEDITKSTKKYRSKIKPEEESQYDKKESKTSNKKLLGI